MTSFAIEKPLHTTISLTPSHPNATLATIQDMMGAAAIENGFDLPHYSEEPGKYNQFLMKVLHRRTYVKEGKWLRVVVGNVLMEGSNNN